MRLLILHMRYAPDPTGTGPLVTQLARDLVGLGDEVCVVTSAPHYGRPLAAGRQADRSGQDEAGVEVIRTAAITRAAGHRLVRALDYALYTILSFFAGLGAGRPDAILAIAPPILVALPAVLLARLWRVPLVFGAQDIWPDGLVHMGQLRPGLAYRLLRRLERWVYRASERIVVVAPGMKANLLAKGVQGDKVETIPNWVDLQAITPQTSGDDFRRRHDLQGRFVVLFAGNLGYAAGLEVALAAAGELQDDARLVLVIVGEGSAKPQLMGLAQRRRLPNMRFVPTVPPQEVSGMLASADLALVTLRPGLGSLSVPSKALAYMASGRPIVAAVPADSEIKTIIERAECGQWVPSGKPAALASAVRALAAAGEELGRMGLRGRAYAEANFARPAAVAAYRRVLAEVLAARHPDNAESGELGESVR
ncbi:MAG TPA: glycosyltransferase family 4 protein [Anaerolineales bacterium]